MIAGKVIWTREPAAPARRIGKVVPFGHSAAQAGQGPLAYVFDNPTRYARLNAYGISETVLVELIREQVGHIHYIVGPDTYATILNHLLENAIVDTMPGARRGYLYLPLKFWHVYNRHFEYPWVSPDKRVDLPWRIDAPEVADWRRRLWAAKREREPMQMGLWA